ncbi:MAG: hypothetical protein DRG76_06990 [Deltaproteobacteria bacterium]|nr:MAG: hypothetical protein DRG76_06990 [Deltaproteobacteria bacterium]
MADNLYITATEARSGKSAISLGIMELVLRKVERVAFFRPIVASAGDNDIDLIASHFKLDTPYEDMFGVTSEEASELIGHGREEEIIEKVIDKYQRLSGDFGFILCEGTDFASVTAAFELDINAEISNNLGSPVLLVANAHQKTPTETIRTIDMALDSLTDKGCQTVATIVNRVNPLQRMETALLTQTQMPASLQKLRSLLHTLPRPSIRVSWDIAFLRGRTGCQLPEKAP